MLMLLLSGKARVGKTTAAKHLAEMFYKQGYKPIILPFASALKNEVEATGLTKENNPEKYRLLCQKLGSDRRKENTDYWVEKFLESVYKIVREEQEDKSLPERVIIADDCRYLNELNIAPRFNALKVFISHNQRVLDDAEEAWRLHESEDLANRTESQDKDYKQMFHFIISNDKTEKGFKNKLSTKYQDIIDAMYHVILEPLCGCELCLADRYDRPVNLTTLNKEIIDMVERLGDENDCA